MNFLRSQLFLLWKASGRVFILSSGLSLLIGISSCRSPSESAGKPDGSSPDIIPIIDVSEPDQDNSDEPFSGSFVLISLEKVFPVNGANWNDFIKKEYTVNSEIESADVSCSSGSRPVDYYGACFHGAEYLKAEIPNNPGCSGLTFKDKLEAFDWVCRETGSSTIIYGLGLKAEKGLSDLLDATSWKLNRLLIFKDN